MAQVIDGDTIVIEGGHHVRYIGIDASERDEPLYREAKEANGALVKGKTVRLERDVSDRDRYGRLLRYVYEDIRNIKPLALPGVLYGLSNRCNF